MVEVLLLTFALNCPALDVPAADEVASVLDTGWGSESVYGTTAPYDFLTPTEPSDGVLTYRIYVDPLYEPYTQCFDAIVEDVLTDSRGWGPVQRAGPTESPQMWIILAPPGIARCGEGSTPYGSCARGGNVNHGIITINVGRWMAGYEPLATVEYSRIKILNHEVGHILGHGHQDCTVMGYFPIHPAVAGGHTEDVGWDSCVPPAWPTRLVADSQL